MFTSSFDWSFTDEESPSSLRRLRYGLNNGDNLTTKIKQLPNLLYLNLRLCHISQEELCELGKFDLIA